MDTRVQADEHRIGPLVCIEYGTAPIIEYSRFNPDVGDAGRFYWSDRFSGEPEYDRVVFSKHVDALWRWVRKSSRRVRLPNSYVHDAWCFPAAIKKFGLKE